MIENKIENKEDYNLIKKEMIRKAKMATSCNGEKRSDWPTLEETIMYLYLEIKDLKNRIDNI